MDESISDMNTYHAIQALIKVKKNDHPSAKNASGWANRFVYSLMHDKYLHIKQKVKGNPKYDLLENEEARKPGSPRIYSRNEQSLRQAMPITLAFRSV